MSGEVGKVHVASSIEAFLRKLVEEGDWGRQPTIGKAPERYLEELFGWDAVRRLLSDVRIPCSMARVLVDGGVIPRSEISVPMRVEGEPVLDVLNIRRVRDYLREGASLQLGGLEEFWPPMRRVCSRFRERSGLDAWSFAVVTPPQSPSLKPHVDKTDEIVLQCLGSKHWTVWGVNAEYYSEEVDPAELGAPVVEEELSVGSMLYLPRGAPHVAEANSSLSGHVTIAVETPTLEEVAVEGFRLGVRREGRALETLPPFWAEYKDEVVERSAELLGEVRSDAHALVAEGLSEWEKGQR